VVADEGELAFRHSGKSDIPGLRERASERERVREERERV
jgi:hypothetical protein